MSAESLQRQTNISVTSFGKHLVNTVVSGRGARGKVGGGEGGGGGWNCPEGYVQQHVEYHSKINVYNFSIQ